MKYLMLLFIVSFIQPSLAGDDPGGGGDIYGKEFEMLARALHQTFENNANHPLLIKWRLKPSLFELTVNTTLIRSAEESEVILNDYEVDAINYQDKRLILINRERWRQKTLLQKLELTLHEYLGVLGIERNNYIVTNEFTDLIVQTYSRIKNSPSPDINLYYGNRKIPPPINSSVLCDEGSKPFADAIELAKTEALGKCRLYNKSCSVLSVDANPIISSTMIGYKYCSITAIAK